MSGVLRIYTYALCISLQKKSNSGLKYVKMFANLTFIEYASCYVAVTLNKKRWLYDEL